MGNTIIYNKNNNNNNNNNESKEEKPHSFYTDRQQNQHIV